MNMLAALFFFVMRALISAPDLEVWSDSDLSS
jgi:hypothetical protein